jgi:hypothetical protein
MMLPVVHTGGMFKSLSTEYAEFSSLFSGSVTGRAQSATEGRRSKSNFSIIGRTSSFMSALHGPRTFFDGSSFCFRQ